MGSILNALYTSHFERRQFFQISLPMLQHGQYFDTEQSKIIPEECHN